VQCNETAIRVIIIASPAKGKEEMRRARIDFHHTERSKQQRLYSLEGCIMRCSSKVKICIYIYCREMEENPSRHYLQEEQGTEGIEEFLLSQGLGIWQLSKTIGLQ
jgi:hypothetical protein